jgi:hypothetical protein
MLLLLQRWTCAPPTPGTPMREPSSARSSTMEVGLATASTNKQTLHSQQGTCTSLPGLW